jgi:type I restriction-modification system DNA methylase subunit
MFFGIFGFFSHTLKYHTFFLCNSGVVTGVFGRIYEYFLTQFADLKAHDGGEFFTPISIVQLIVNVIEPDHGTVLDPACGSGGMFVQSAHFIEHLKKDPTVRIPLPRLAR